MTSTIYLLTLTLARRYKLEIPFYEFALEEFPGVISDHLPSHIHFKSIEYKKDTIVSSFLEELAAGMMRDSPNLIYRMDSELGYFVIELESPGDLTHRRLDFMEFIMKRLHENYSLITSWFYYLGEKGFSRFIKQYTPKYKDDADESHLKSLDYYVPFFESYLYQGIVPETYAHDIAKLLLLRSNT